MSLAIKESVFSSLPDDVCGLFENGLPNGKKVADILEFKRKDIAEAARLPESSIRFETNRMPDELKDRMREWAIAINLVGNFFHDPDKTHLWFQVSNPMFGNMTPKDMIRIGRFKKLLAYIQQSLEGRHP